MPPATPRAPTLTRLIPTLVSPIKEYVGGRFDVNRSPYPLSRETEKWGCL